MYRMIGHECVGACRSLHYLGCQSLQMASNGVSHQCITFERKIFSHESRNWI